MNVKAISINVGKALMVSALFMFISVIVSIIYGMDSAFAPLLISCIITAIVAFFPFIFVKGSYPMNLHDAFIVITLSWLLSFIFGMLPYVLWGGEFTLMNAWFESVSGFTTTGATILTSVETLPKSLLFWRSSTHFIGGLGVVVFLLLVLPDANPYRLKLTNMELSSLSREGYRYKSTKTISIITIVYLSLVIASTLCYWAAGMNFYDAINHGFATISTGGFSTKNASIGHFDSPWITVICMIFMTLGATHFGLIYASVSHRSIKPFKTPTIGLYLGSMAVMTLLIAFSLVTQGDYTSWGRALMDSSFNVVSYTTTTGFATVDNSVWPWFAGSILMYAAIQCGCSGSTTGGLKVDRIVISFKAIGSHLNRMLHPSSVSQVRMGKHLLSDKLVNGVLLYIVLYMIITFVSIFIVTLSGTDVTEAVSSVICSIGNVGPGLGEVGSLGNYSNHPEIAKFVLTFDMFFGRIEIYPLLVTVWLMFNRKR